MVVASNLPTTFDTKTAFVIPLDVLTSAWKIDSPALSQRVFLSSAPGDASFAEQLSADLQMRGVVVWNEQKGPDGIPVSDEKQLQLAIRAAQAVVLIVSPQTRASRTVKEHLRLVDLYQRRLIRIWVGDDPDVQPQRYGWHETTWIDVHKESYPLILETIEDSLSQDQDRLTSIMALLGPSDERPQPEPRNPYKGLRAFTAEDTKDFFGRDRLVNQLVKDVQELLVSDPATSDQGRLLALIGPSGSGKSSVLMAGLLPKLQHNALPDSAKWAYLEPMVPGKRPLENLASVLKPYFPDSSIKTLREDLDDDATRGLHLLAAQLVNKSDTKVLLIVDQFEELFTQTESETERQQFVELLLTAATEQHGPVVVLLTIRADFYDRLMQHLALNRLLQAHLIQVLPLDVEDLRATIEQPAVQPDVRLTFEGNLLGDLLFEMQGQVGALPLLQFTLYQLFERRRGHRLTLQTYHELGGVKGALAQHAEKTYASLPTEEHRRLAQALFLRLIEPGATEQDTTRRRASLTEFVYDSKQTKVMGETINAFVAARLLMTNDITGVKTLEVSHEAVIREWPRLATWVREAREYIPLQKAVCDDAEEWMNHRKQKDRLYRGTQLKEAQAWAKHYMVSEREMAFLRAGERQQQRSNLLKGTIIFMILILLIPLGLLGVPQLISFAQQNNLLSITVTSLDDNGPGSLRAAIQTASPKNNTITFDPGLKGKTIMLTNNLVLEKSLNLLGPGVTISSGKHDYEILVDSKISVRIEGLAFKEGVLAKSDFIRNSGNLEFEHTVFSDNSILGLHKGLIYNNGGKLTISNSVISNNIGEIYNAGGPMEITNSIISNMNRNNKNKTPENTSPPVYNDGGGSLTIRDSTIADNISYFNGGGIYNAGQLTISDSTISGNNIPPVPSYPFNNGGGIANDEGGTLTITNSTIADNTAAESGGGIANLSGKTLISFCTIFGNSARAGGGIAILGGGCHAEQ
jgi:hypothetical protein